MNCTNANLKSKLPITMFSIFLCGLISLSFFGSSLNAQESEEKNEFKNLKILPQDITEEQIMPIMRNFSHALGVRCSGCHVIDTTGAKPKMDYASEENKLKEAARVMMNLVNEINNTTSVKMGIPEDKLLKVSCMTCHRGQMEPHLIDEVLMEAYTDDGVDTMLSRYTYLRDEYYGSHTYDFTSGVLIDIGSQLNEAGDVDDALKVFMFNLDFFPTSSWNYAEVAFVHASKGDTAQAITFMNQAIEHSPEVPWYKKQLKKFTGE